MAKQQIQLDNAEVLQIIQNKTTGTVTMQIVDGEKKQVATVVVQFTDPAKVAPFTMGEKRSITIK